MSYTSTVLSHSPIGFYRSNNIALNPVSSYADLLLTFSTYQQFLSYYPDYKAATENSLIDQSGCLNNGQYVGGIDTKNPPLVYGESYAIKISPQGYLFASIVNDYYSSNSSGGFATKYNSDNDFSIEAWVYPSITTSAKTALFADIQNNIGLFYENGSLVFDIGSEQLYWTIPYLKKAMHIVVSYTNKSIEIYTDGILRKTKLINDFRFINESVSFQSGPTLNSADTFLINGIAVYRYALDSTIVASHYAAGQSLPAFQIAVPDNGELFDLYDTNISTYYSYNYPANKSWNSLKVDGLYYNQLIDSLEIKKGIGASQNLIIEDVISIPTGPDLNDSRIEWDGSNGISILTKVSASDTYVLCENGKSIPQYSADGFDASKNLFIKIIFNTSDDSKYIPSLSHVAINFYNNQTIYAKNSGAYITTDKSINLSNYQYPILSKDHRNGIILPGNSSFILNNTRSIKTVEFFITPEAATNNGSLFNFIDFTSRTINNSVSEYPQVFINGVNKTSETDISLLLPEEELIHVVLVYSSSLDGYTPKFQYPGTYQNVCLYTYAFDQAKVSEHYALWTGFDPVSVNDSSLTMTENSVSAYNNDWLVIQNI